MVLFIDEENIVTYVDFDCGFASYPAAPTKLGHINREKKNNSRSFKKPKYIPENDHHNCSDDEEPTFIVFFNPYIL